MTLFSDQRRIALSIAAAAIGCMLAALWFALGTSLSLYVALAFSVVGGLSLALAAYIAPAKGLSFETLIDDRTMVLQAEEIPGADQLCEQCGHPFNPHRLLGHGNPPTEGWMECAVEGCTCKMTWDMAYGVSDKIKATFKPLPE